MLLLFDIIVRSFVRRVLISESIYDTRNGALWTPVHSFSNWKREERKNPHISYTHTHISFDINPLSNRRRKESRQNAQRRRRLFFEDDDDDFDDFDDDYYSEGGFDDDDGKVESSSRAGQRFWTQKKKSSLLRARH